MNPGAIMAGFIAMGCLVLLALAAAAYSWDWALRTAALGQQAAVDAGRAHEMAMSLACARFSPAPAIPPRCCSWCLVPGGRGGLMPCHADDGKVSWRCIDLHDCLAAARMLAYGSAS